jgi:hypothetical protein
VILVGEIVIVGIKLFLVGSVAMLFWSIIELIRDAG